MRKKKQRVKKKNAPSKYAVQAAKEDSQSNDWSRIEVVAQVNKEKEAKTQKHKWLKKWGSKEKGKISIPKTEK